MDEPVSDQLMMSRWLKFNAAGILRIVVQIGTLQLLTCFAVVNYLVATIIAVELAILHNFIWHERYTWRARTERGSQSAARRLLHFNLSNGAISLLGNILLMKWLVGSFGLPLVPANICAIVACSTLNFLIAEFFVFAPQTETSGREPLL